MDRREFPILSSAEETHVERMAAGLGDTPSRAFVYLWRRSVESGIETEAATQMEIRIGTGSSRKAIQDAIDILEKRNLIEADTVETERPGRPPNAWRVTRPLPEIIDRVYDQHADRLLTQASSITDGDWTVDSGEGTNRQAEPITVGLNWQPNELQLPLFAAETDGQYSGRELSVEWSEFSGSHRAAEGVLSGQATVGIAGAATVLRTRSNGEPLVPIATLFQRPMVVLYTIRDTFGEKLERVEQLRGRKVGMPASSETGLLSQLFLSQAGVLGDIECVDLHGEEYDGLDSGDVDAVTGIFSDPLRLESNGITVDSIHVADRYPIYGPTLVTSERVLQEGADRISRFLAGTTAGWAIATAEPRESAERISGATDRRPEWMADVFERAVSEFAASKEGIQHGWGWQTEETWQRLETALDQTNLLETTP